MTPKKVENQLADFDELGLSRLPLQELMGRQFKAGGSWYIDFVNTNYLGFECEELLEQRGLQYSRTLGQMAGWSRLEVDPLVYPGLEEQVAAFLGASQVQLSHTVTITVLSLMPAIAEQGVIFTDKELHTVVWESCRLARDHGAKICPFDHSNLEDLESKLKSNEGVSPKVIAVDGVYSISADLAPVAELQALCDRYDAWLVVDDAHGFGILGANPSQERPYGTSGNGIVCYSGGNYERTFYITSFGKAFSTAGAFAVIPNLYRKNLHIRSLQYIFSAPLTPFSIGAISAVLQLNEQKGDDLRGIIYQRTEQLVSGLRELEVAHWNSISLPIVYLPIGSSIRLREVASRLWEMGIVAGIRAYPLIHEDLCGLRFAVSSLHTEEHVGRTLEAISSIKCLGYL